MGQELYKLDSITTLITGSPTSERELYIEAERRRQEFAISFTELKTDISVKLTKENAWKVAQIMDELAEQLASLAPRISKLSPRYRDLMIEVCEDQFIRCYKNVTAIQDIGIKNIAHVVALSLLIEPPPPPEPKMIPTTYYSAPPPRKGFFARLLGL